MASQPTFPFVIPDVHVLSKVSQTICSRIFFLFQYTFCLIATLLQLLEAIGQVDPGFPHPLFVDTLVLPFVSAHIPFFLGSLCGSFATEHSFL